MSKFTAMMTPVDDFGGHSKVRYGVGERVELEVKEEPAVRPATPVEWAVKSGPATVKNGQLAGAAILTCGNKPGAVVLELRNKNDKSVVATQRLEVVAPTGAKFAATPLNFRGGAGFVGEIYLEPADVSFKWVEMREGAAPYEGSGCFQKAQVGLEDVADSYAVIHPVMGKWVKCLGGGKKNKMAGQDTVKSAIPRNYGQGGKFQWKIPWFYRVEGAAGEARFLTAIHQETVDASGKMTISKLNVKINKQLAPSG
jgi:hypothetical protein